MKKWFVIVLAAIALFAQPFAAYADAVYGNEFYFDHEDEAVYLNQAFYLNGPDGYVSIYESPGDKKPVGSYENGQTVRIYAVCNYKGAYWGIPPMSHRYAFPCWYPMDELLMCYDKTDFEAAHQDELYDYTGGFGALCESEDYYIWQWPGSDREKMHYYLDDYGGLNKESSYNARYAWLDSEGREWVCTIIFEGDTYGESRGGSTEGWICISDPGNARIPAFNPAPDPAPWSPDSLPGWARSGSTGGRIEDTSHSAAFMYPDTAPAKGAIPPYIIAVIVVAAIGGLTALVQASRKRKARP
ncbi:MAG: hypothetical protein FWG03_11325 [Clostridiales bacterium]|nr:hypothetical protein [Clostridiales bacterium]